MLITHQAPSVRDAARPRKMERAFEDIGQGLRGWRLPFALARLDIRNRYRGSVLGPFWLTLSTAVMLIGLGLLYSTLFRLDLSTYLPFLAVSLILWNAISAMVSEGSNCLIEQESIIRQMPQPYSVHILRCVFRNALIAAHSLPLIALVFLICGYTPGWVGLWALPGVALFLVNALAVATLFGMLSARFRDIGPIVASVMQIAFFMSPVIWKPELLGDRQRYLPLNPFYVVMETVRGPLVEGGVSPWLWLAAMLYSALLCGAAFFIFLRFRNRVAFWV
ncbi:MAG: ABC transporter permease [Rubritepida sp.]|nr:ABC transporter permease [Rubritepida sp.]